MAELTLADFEPRGEVGPRLSGPLDRPDARVAPDSKDIDGFLDLETADPCRIDVEEALSDEERDRLYVLGSVVREFHNWPVRDDDVVSSPDVTE